MKRMLLMNGIWRRIKRRFFCDFVSKLRQGWPEGGEGKPPQAMLLSEDNYDNEYFEDPANLSQIVNNIKSRKSKHLIDQLNQAKACPEDQPKMASFIRKNMAQLPNQLDPVWLKRQETKTELREVITEVIGEKPTLDFTPKKAEKLAQKWGSLYLSRPPDSLGLVGGHRSYALFGDLARLELALTRWTTRQLVQKFGFSPISVPSLVYDEIISGCGFNPNRERAQVYSIDGKTNIQWKEKVINNLSDEGNRICLTGTAEIPLVALHLGTRFECPEDLPKRYCATSRCYRAETATIREESGLFRVHYFTKVEMVGLTTIESSHGMLQEIVDIQKYLFSQLGLHFRVVDMPPHELGLPAYRKMDIECWFPGRKSWGEISSASNCTDYQSRRFNIKRRYLCPDYETNQPFREEFVATVNGTGCAVPRMLIAILESYQDAKGKVAVPRVLWEDMDGQQVIDGSHGHKDMFHK